MSYTKKVEDLKRKLTDTAKDLDEKYKIKETVQQGAKRAGDELRRGADAAAAGIESAQQEWQKIDHEYDLSGKVKRSAEDLSEKVKHSTEDLTGKAKRSTQDVAGVVKEKARQAEEKADELLGEAGKYYDRFARVTDAAGKSARFSRTVKTNFDKAREWVKQNPGKTALITVSLVTGTQAGRAFPGLDVAVFGAGSQGHWLFHSALAAYGLRKVSERYFDYLKKQEELIRTGRLSDSEAAQVEFQRNVARYVGAPLLGAFSVATGVTLIAESLSPGRIVGAPLELILGGSPLLSSIWLFSNGLVCIHNGYRFFVMAMADEEAVTQFVREARYLLPA